MTEPMIKTDHLSHTYEDEDGKVVYALKDISLEIGKGEFVAIIGTNGSGKSTLAKHFNVLLTPTSGTCEVCGMRTNDPDNIWKIRQHVGMVFQNPDNQIVAAVVEEDVAFGPENLGIPSDEIKARVSDALRRAAARSSASPLPVSWPCSVTASSWTNRRPCSTPSAARKSWIRFISSMTKALPSSSSLISWKKPSRPTASSSSTGLK